METILNYLENMFLHLPQTTEVLRAKQELANMMEDKYNELIAEGKKENEAVGIVISEFGNLEELANELGLEQFMNQGANNYGTEERSVSQSEGMEYLKLTQKTSIWISFAVMLCIFSPIALITLGGLQDVYQNISDAGVVLFGIIPLLLLIGIAVAIFIYHGMKMEKYEYLKKEPIQIDKSLDSYLDELAEKERPKSTVKIIAGVLCCIFSVIPLLVVGALSNNDMHAIYALDFLLIVVGVAIWFFIAGGSKMEANKVLRQEGDFSKGGKKSAKVIDVIAGIYWPVATVIYLIWSITSMDWGYTWIVWPIAGIVFGLIAAICSIIGNVIEK